MKPKNGSKNLNINKTLSDYRSEVDLLQGKLQDKENKLDMLETTCKNLETIIEAKDEELKSAKLQITASDSDMNNNNFRTVTRKREGRHENEKPKVILIGTSNITGIDPEKVSKKFEIEKIVAYSFSETDSKLKVLNSTAQVIVFHSLTNEMVDNSAEFCVKEIKRIAQVAIELNPGV